MHDLILRNRVSGYREGGLLQHLYGAGARVAFEHYVPGHLAALPVEAYPFLVARMRKWRETRGLSRRQLPLAKRALAIIRERGPISAADVGDDRRALSAWGNSTTLAKATLDELFLHGRVLISRRDGFRRVYDLPERVLPARVLRRKEPTPAAVAAWLVQLRLRQRRLVRLAPRALALVADEVQRVSVPDMPPLYCLRDDVPRLLRAAEGACTAAPILLAPLDPVIYDRRVTLGLWSYDYIWEVYTPAAKRKRGYYALPILAGERLEGHVDPKIDRERGRLIVNSRSVPRGVAVASALAELRAFVGLARAAKASVD